MSGKLLDLGTCVARVTVSSEGASDVVRLYELGSSGSIVINKEGICKLRDEFNAAYPVKEAPKVDYNLIYKARKSYLLAHYSLDEVTDLLTYILGDSK